MKTFIFHYLSILTRFLLCFLFSEYRCNRNALLLSHLYRPLEISGLPEHIMSSIIKNSQVLKRFGVTFKQISDFTVNVSTVPNCFLSKKRNSGIMGNSVKELIMDIGGMLISKSGTKCLPAAIHNAVASEACHGEFQYSIIYKNMQKWKITRNI